MTETSASLDFRMLDGLAFAAARGRLTKENMPSITAVEIGPFFELLSLSKDGLLPSPLEEGWLTAASLKPMANALKGGAEHWFGPDANGVGFLRTTESYDLVTWTAFGLAGQKAAISAGFPKPIAAQFIAALGELHSNIYEHCQDPGSGITAFSSAPGRFELVATDRGVGVLNSLRTNSNFTTLEDHGTALRLAISDGVSRFEFARDRGHGFQPIFVGLANLNGTLRFRSGDHALVIGGRNLSTMAARASQKAMTQGFHVSVSCLLN